MASPDAGIVTWRFQTDYDSDNIANIDPAALCEKLTDENPVPFHWSEDITKKFILLRHEKRNYFCGKRFLTQKAWMEILKELDAEKQLTIAQARKKWGNLVLKYKQLKGLPTQCNSPLPGRDTAETWPYFDIMDEVMGRPPSIIKPMSVVASARLPEDKTPKQLTEFVEYLNTVDSDENVSGSKSAKQGSKSSVYVLSPSNGPYQTFQIMLQDGAEVDASTIKELLENHEATIIREAGDMGTDMDSNTADSNIVEETADAIPGELQELLNSVQPHQSTESQNVLTSVEIPPGKVEEPTKKVPRENVRDVPPLKRLKSNKVLERKDNGFLQWLEESMQRCNERQAIFESQGQRLNQLFDELVDCVRSQKKKDSTEGGEDEEDEEEDNDLEIGNTEMESVVEVSS